MRNANSSQQLLTIASRTDQPPELAGLEPFHPVVRTWFAASYGRPTPVQSQAWPLIARGASTLMLAPTGSGKTLAAFLIAINRLMFAARAERAPRGTRVLYISPLKALGVDVERNLQTPIAGIRAAAEQARIPFHEPTIGIRSGDTTGTERSRLVRRPTDVLITTPESLYLMLTSRARETLATVEQVIVDEIHALAPVKRGVHLFVSLERLESFRKSQNPDCPPLQRIGLSATQRPLEEIARLLGGAEWTASSSSAEPLLSPRPVEIISAGMRKQLNLTIEVPVDDMRRLGASASVESVPSVRSVSRNPPAAPSSSAAPVTSIWPAIYPRLVELIRAHRSTMLFVNSRRLAERLSAAINELAGAEIALAHHGSIAKEARQRIEQRLKSGDLPAIVATSSLELGIDMGAVDLVIQIEAPPSIAAGLQRIGRAGHQVGEPSTGVIFPKYRGDLLACSAAAARMTRGEVEETFYPRNPLDVLAQQLVAMVAIEPMPADELYATIRRAAPFAELSRASFNGVLDLLAGKYPSDDFAELRPRVTWDRTRGIVSPRAGAQRVAVVNAGVIPDRGLYGVYLADSQTQARVGELDEEMVFESKPGDVFLLGASTWRITDITQDRVLVVPAPGELARMPFWRGDGPGRPLEFGRAIGQLARELTGQRTSEAERRLADEHGLDRRAARNLVTYLHDQVAAAGDVPSDRKLIVECFPDEVGDWRVCLLSPFGARVHAPWAMAIAARLRAETTGEVDQMWTDDGIAFRLPESDEPPPLAWLTPTADEIEATIVRELGGTSFYAARFRENAARALLLPKRQPGRRTPLWIQRRRAADLLSVASRFPDFPILLETYRECLRDVFDIQGLKSILRDIERGEIEVKGVRTRAPSPFASALLFTYAGHFLYEGDAPLAERRAQTLALDHAQLRELLGDAELRELLDPESIEAYAAELQCLDARYHARHADGLHDLLLRLGDLSRHELRQRTDAARGTDATRDTDATHHADTTRETDDALDDWLATLAANQRIINVRIAGESRWAAVEDAVRLRDALGTNIPADLPTALLTPVADPVGDLVSRFARTHVPFRLEDAARRLGVGAAVVRETLERLASRGRVVEGEFLPNGRGREWCDANVLRTLKQRSLARLRKQIEPVEPSALARFLPAWQGVENPRRGLDALLDVVEQLQGLALPAETLETEILPSRIADYRPSQLDELCAAGEVVWRGCESLGASDGRIALFLTDRAPQLAADLPPVAGDLAARVREHLSQRGALFFDDLARLVGGFRNDVLAALWEMTWAGEVTNDTLAPVRSLRRGGKTEQNRRRAAAFRSRRTVKLPGSEGRWSLFRRTGESLVTVTERQASLAKQLLVRYGIVTREIVANEGIAGGFGGLYPVFKSLEEAGQARRGYFVAGLGGAQFASPGAEQRLRQTRDARAAPDQSSQSLTTLFLAATDPANPFGMALRWPESSTSDARPQRAAGARVIVRDGQLLGYLNRSGQQLLTFDADDEPERTIRLELLADALAGLASTSRAVFITHIDGQDASASRRITKKLLERGFVLTSKGLLKRRLTEE